MIPRTLAIVALTAALGAGCAPRDDAAAAVAAGQPVPAPPDVAAVPKDAHVTPSGLASKILRVGLSNIHPSIRSRVTVIYTGWTTDGKMFETSLSNGRPMGPTPLTELIKGWQEGLPLMVVGEKRRFWIPAELAYADSKTHPQGMLVFDIELLEVR